MSGELETSLELSAGEKISRFPGSARNDKAQQPARSLFAHLIIYQDKTVRSAAMNMSVDEALLESAVTPTIRFYRWRSPSVSFGYFGKFSDVAIYSAKRDLVRRWTGGGIVFHGDDLTYSIVIPASDPAFNESSTVIYEKIHCALANAVNGFGEHAIVAGRVDRSGVALSKPAVNASGHNCFTNPVHADLMMDGRKIAGAAQRRSHHGLLQQGSIQGFSVNTDLGRKFADALSANCGQFEIDEQILERAQELVGQKYGTDSWLRKR